MNDTFLSFEPVLNRQLQIGLDSGWRIVEEVAMALFVGVGFVLRCIIFAYLKQREIKRLQQRRDHLAHLRVKAEEQVNPLYNVSVFYFTNGPYLAFLFISVLFILSTMTHIVVQNLTIKLQMVCMGFEPESTE